MIDSRRIKEWFRQRGHAPRAVLPFIAAVVLAALADGCTSAPGKVGDLIAARLPEMLGPADRYEAQVHADLFEMMRGKLRSVHIHGENVALSPALRVAVFDADASDIHADTRTDTIRSVGPTSFRATMNQADLDNYVRTARPDDFSRGARIVLGRHELTYADSLSLLGLHAPFAVTGTLSPVAGRPTRMDFTASGASLASLSVPARLVEIAVSRENPVVDLSQMKYPVAIKNASVDNGRLIIEGSADLSSLAGAKTAN